MGAEVASLSGNGKQTTPLLLAYQKKLVGEENKGIENKKTEIMLFNQKQQYVKVLPTATASYTPVAEPAKATAVSTTPIFNFARTNSTTERGASQHVGIAYTGATVASALTSPEKNSGSNDKKDEGNNFLSAHKTLKQLRMETLEKDDILRSIMGNVC